MLANGARSRAHARSGYGGSALAANPLGHRTPLVRQPVVTVRAEKRSQVSGGESSENRKSPWTGASSPAHHRWRLSRSAQLFIAAAGTSLIAPFAAQNACHARAVTSSATKDECAPATSADLQKPAKEESRPQAPNEPQLQLVSGGFIIPHPAKVEKGGEDAYFIAKNNRSIGVADGVGGWADVGVDPGNFSRSLMREARKAAEQQPLADTALEPSSILEAAYERSKEIKGSSTACIMCVNGSNVQASNLGDSGFLIVRDGKLVFESPSQQHSFNFPFQVGSFGDPISSSQVFSIKVQPGDIIIMGSDGLLDNVFNTRSAKLVWEAKKRGATPGVAAQQLAMFAANRSRDPVYLSPFAKSAREAGFYYQGGKVDDITVVISYVCAHSEVKLPQAAPALSSSSNAPLSSKL